MPAASEEACDYAREPCYYRRWQQRYCKQRQRDEKRNELFVAQPDVNKGCEHERYPARAGVGHDKRNGRERKPDQQHDAAQLLFARSGKRRAQRHEQNEKFREVVRVIERRCNSAGNAGVELEIGEGCADVNKAELALYNGVKRGEDNCGIDKCKQLHKALFVAYIGGNDIGEDKCRNEKQQYSYAVGAALRKQQADKQRYCKQSKRKAQLIGIQKLSLSTADEDKIQRKEAHGGNDRICIVPALVRHDEHKAYKRAEQELKIQNKAAAAKPCNKAALPRRGEKACNGGENFFDKIKDEADNARKQRSFVHRLDAVAAPQPLYQSKIVVSPFKRPPDLFEYGKEHAVSPGIINIV